MIERNGRKNYIQQSGMRGVTMWLALFLFVIKVIYMSYKNGMYGMTYYAFADVFYVGFYILFGIAVVPVMKKMICFQMNKGSYRNGYKVYKTISAFIHVLAFILCFVCFVFSDMLSRAIFGTVLCSLMLKLVSVALLFVISAFCMKGYMEGIGNPIPGMYADVLTQLVSLIVTVLFQPTFADYGRKVAAVMGQDSYAYAYAACSGLVGLVLGGMIGFLFLLFVKNVFGKEIKHRIRQDEMRKTDTLQDIFWNFFGGYVKTTFAEYIGVLLIVLLVILYCHVQGRIDTGAGMLFTGIALVVLPAGVLSAQITAPFSRQLTSIMRQADFHLAKEKMAFSLKLLSYTILPYVTMGFALAPLLGKVFFDIELETFAGYIRIGTGIAMLLSFGLFFKHTFAVFSKPYMRNFYAGILGISGFLFFLLLRQYKVGGEENVGYSYLLACLVYLLITCFAVFKKIRIFNRLVGSIAVPFISAILAAAVSYGVYRLLISVMPDVAVFILCVMAGYVVHNMIIVLLGVFEPHEWNEVPYSDIPKAFAKMIGRY